MTDAEIIEIIAEGIVDGTDMDCTPADQAQAVLKALRDAGVAVGKVKSLEWQIVPWLPAPAVFFYAQSRFGQYGYGIDFEGLSYAEIPGQRKYLECGTEIEAAKVAAQADYEARILAALEQPQ